MTSVERRVDADLALLPASRGELVTWLDRLAAHPAEQRAEIVLVFVELLANAIEASDPDGVVRIEWRHENATTTLRFTNENPNETAVELRSMPRPVSESGRGLAIAQLYASRLDLHAAGRTVDISAHFSTQDD